MSASRPGRLVGGLAVAAVIALSACGGDKDSGTPAASEAAPTTASNGSELTRLADIIAGQGLPVPEPHIVTGRDCPSIGCTSKLDSNTVTFTRFPTSGKAEIYYSTLPAGEAYQVYSLVVGFAPGIAPDKRQKYEAAISRAIS